MKSLSDKAKQQAKDAVSGLDSNQVKLDQSSSTPSGTGFSKYKGEYAPQLEAGRQGKVRQNEGLWERKSEAEKANPVKAPHEVSPSSTPSRSSKQGWMLSQPESGSAYEQVQNIGNTLTEKGVSYKTDDTVNKNQTPQEQKSGQKTREFLEASKNSFHKNKELGYAQPALQTEDFKRSMHKTQELEKEKETYGMEKES